MELREIQDWIIKPQLRNVEGVTEVNTIGGFEKQYHVTPYPAKLLAYGISMHDVVEALGKNNENIGAGYIEKNGEQYLIRAPGQVKGIEEIKKIVISTHRGVPVYVEDIAGVALGYDPRAGAGTRDGKETVIGTVFMLMGANSRVVSQNVGKRMEEINKTLPEGVVVETVYDRTSLVDKTISTVRNNLLEGAILVIVVLFVFLGNFKAALITAMVIPFSMLFTVTGMVRYNVSGNLMSLGALDFGLIVDGAVIIVENCISRLAHAQKELGRIMTLKERLNVVFEGSREVRRATMFGELIIMIVYIPILTLTGVEGKMFTPMALTVIMALFGAMILSVTFVPAAVALFLSGSVTEKENPIMKRADRLYRSVLDVIMGRSKEIFASALVLILLCLGVASTMGTEFIPSLDEGDIAAHAMRIPGTGIDHAVEMQKILEKEIIDIPEVETVFSKIGTAEVASDPMPPNVADTFIILKPKDQWPDSGRTKEDVVTTISNHFAEVPGNAYEYTQPIQMRFNELISGVRADVALKLFGDDMDKLVDYADKAAAIIATVPGAADTRTEQVKGLPVLTIQINRSRISRLGLNISDVQQVIETAIGGKKAGKIYEGDRRFDLVVRLPESIRSDLSAIKKIPIPLPKELDSDGFSSTDGTEGMSRFVTLSSVAEIKMAPGPNQISRENGKRRVVVTTNVRGRDIGSFVTEAQASVGEKLKIEAGYWAEWGGQFEQMISAARTLQIVVPISLLLILILLFATFRNMTDSLLVFTGVPMALTGGILAIFFRGIPLSISAGVGFIALSGVAVLNGLVMISFINKLREDGLTLEDAVRQGALSRLRPVLMTALVAALGFVPMALATGTGAEVQRPLATVVIGGILSSTLLTLVVLPLLYLKVHGRRT
jgi:cobalt-zinc-cadmium resistance protein CzcA